VTRDKRTSDKGIARIIKRQVVRQRVIRCGRRLAGCDLFLVLAGGRESGSVDTGVYWIAMCSVLCLVHPSVKGV
jgi:hypothetical protein